MAGNFVSFPTLLTSWLQYEAHPDYCRENVTVASGEDMDTGTIVGKTLFGGVTATADAGNTGNGVMGTITLGADTVVGDYVVTVTAEAVDSGSFKVEDPNGNLIGNGTVGVAFVSGHVSFTLADGAEDFDIGDFITLSVAAGDGKVKTLSLTATDGTAAPFGVLFHTTNGALAADASKFVVRRGPVILAEEGLTYPSGATEGQIATINAQLESLGMIVRHAG